MSIRLSEFLIDKCLALLRLGHMLHIYHGELYTRAIVITLKLHINELFIHDVQDIQRLADGTLEFNEINDSLREEILALKEILNIFIQTAASPPKACGRYA